MIKNIFGNDLVNTIADTFFDPFFGRNQYLFKEATDKDGVAVVEPNYEINSDDAGAYVELEMPGVKKEDIDVTVDKGVVVIVGTRTKKSGKVRYRKAFRVGESVDAGMAKVGYADGVLTLTIPNKKKEEPAARKITVEQYRLTIREPKKTPGLLRVFFGLL